jgi:hypothetical protein
LAPRKLTPPLHSLPPILDSESRTPISSCSKGSRGLSVQPRVLGIFTETTVSPDPSKRQCPSRYAIRAGRNFASILHFWRRRLSLHLGAATSSLTHLLTWNSRLLQGPASDHVHRFGLRQGTRSHVLTADDQSLRGQLRRATSHGITLSLLRRP